MKTGATSFLQPPADFHPKMHAAGCFLECNHEILYLKRSKDREEGETWCIPGGKIEVDESPKNAAIREIFEEVGIELDERTLFFLGVLYMRLPSGLDYTFHMFHQEFSSKPLVHLNLIEHSEALWTPLSEIETLPLIRGGIDALQLYKSRQKNILLSNSKPVT